MYYSVASLSKLSSVIVSLARYEQQKCSFEGLYYFLVLG